MHRPALILAAAAAAAVQALATPAWAQQQQPPKAEAAAPLPWITPEAVTASSQCYGKTMWSNPGLAPVLARIRPAGRDPSAPMEYSTEKISAQEKPALLIWLAEMDKCQTVSDLALANAPTQAKAVIRNWHAATAEAIRKAYESQQTSWAELMAPINAATEIRGTQFKALQDAQNAEEKRINEEETAAAGAPSAASQAFNQCTTAMWANPAMAPVAARMVVHTREAADRTLQSTEKASDQEKTAIAFWLTELQKCQKLGDADLVNRPAPARDAIHRWQADTRQATQQLYAGTLTWGAFAQTINDRNRSFKAQFDALIRQQNAERKRQAEAAAPKAAQ